MPTDNVDCNHAKLLPHYNFAVAAVVAVGSSAVAIDKFEFLTADCLAFGDDVAVVANAEVVVEEGVELQVEQYFLD